MTRARQEQISVQDTPYYHCIMRCVRRAYLCGNDAHSGQNYNHRRQWITDKIQELGGIYCIDVCAYAVMSNHFHVVLHINQDQAGQLSQEEVIDRWTLLFNPSPIVQRYLTGEKLLKVELELLHKNIELWRERLMDISWFMRCLNESIARQANLEDGCKGRFWEGRFKSQALLDEAALLTCMVYVDLNPVRAGMCRTPEQSNFTSIQQRIKQYANKNKRKKQPSNLKLLATTSTQHKNRIPFKLTDYFELVDWTGRISRSDKRGKIPNRYPPILQRLKLDPDKWVEHMEGQRSQSSIALGALHRLQRYAENCGFKWLCGQGYNRGLFGV